MTIEIAGLVNDSIVDGPGLRFSIFTQGCEHHCPGCHNPQSHTQGGGTLFDTDEIVAMIAQNPLIKGVTFSGGEPLLQIAPLFAIATEVKKMNLHLMIYTGYLWEELIDMDGVLDLLALVDVLVDGKFDSAQKSLELKFRGSANQRVIDVQKSLKKGDVVPYIWS